MGKRKRPEKQLTFREMTELTADIFRTHAENPQAGLGFWLPTVQECLPLLSDCRTRVGKRLVPSIELPFWRPTDFPSEWKDDQRKRAIDAADAMAGLVAMEYHRQQGMVERAIRDGVLLGMALTRLGFRADERLAHIERQKILKLIGPHVAKGETNRQVILDAYRALPNGKKKTRKVAALAKLLGVGKSTIWRHLRREE